MIIIEALVLIALIKMAIKLVVKAHNAIFNR